MFLQAEKPNLSIWDPVFGTLPPTWVLKRLAWCSWCRHMYLTARWVLQGKLHLAEALRLLSWDLGLSNEVGAVRETTDWIHLPWPGMMIITWAVFPEASVRHVVSSRNQMGKTRREIKGGRRHQPTGCPANFPAESLDEIGPGWEMRTTSKDQCWLNTAWQDMTGQSSRRYPLSP